MESNREIGRFHSFNDAANHILQLLSAQLNINTLFIAQNDGQTNKVMKAINVGETLIEEGSSLPFEQTFCSLVIQHDKKVLEITDISKDEQAGKLGISSKYGNGSFIGIPVYYENGEIYGTICGLDRHPVEFTEEHQKSFELMSSFLTYVLELAKADEEIRSLSSPFVPITEGVYIFPIIGSLTSARLQTIIEDTSTKLENGMDYLIIDFSGVTKIDSMIDEHLLKLINILKLVGVMPVITGIQAFMALKVPHFAVSLKGVMMEANVSTALKKLGFVFAEKK